MNVLGVLLIAGMMLVVLVPMLAIRGPHMVDGSTPRRRPIKEPALPPVEELLAYPCCDRPVGTRHVPGCLWGPPPPNPAIWSDR